MDENSALKALTGAIQNRLDQSVLGSTSTPAGIQRLAHDLARFMAEHDNAHAYMRALRPDLHPKYVSILVDESDHNKPVLAFPCRELAVMQATQAFVNAAHWSPTGKPENYGVLEVPLSHGLRHYNPAQWDSEKEPDWYWETVDKDNPCTKG